MYRLLFSLLLGTVLSSPALARNIDYSINGQTYQGYYLSPSADAPLILLLHDWDGLTGYEKRRAQMLFELGYSVFAADLFGKGIRPTKVTDKRQHTGELYQNREKLRALMQGALAVAQTHGAQPQGVVAVGYCFGGAAVLELARSGAPLQGFVSFHGGLSTPAGQSYHQTQGEILVFHGSADTAISLDDFAQLGKELEAAGISHEMTTYSGAPHAFTVFDSPRYHAPADRASWQRFVRYLADSL